MVLKKRARISLTRRNVRLEKFSNVQVTFARQCIHYSVTINTQLQPRSRKGSRITRQHPCARCNETGNICLQLNASNYLTTSHHIIRTGAEKLCSIMGAATSGFVADHILSA